MTSKIHGLCSKCGKRKTCKAPCAPIEYYLKRENLTVFEKQQPDGTTILYPRSREQHESYFTGEIELNKVREAFSTDNDTPWANYEPNFKYTMVMIQKLEGMTFKQIADFHEVDQSTVIKHYYKAVDKVMSLILQIDQVRKAMSPEERKRRHRKAQQRYAAKQSKKNILLY